MRYALILACLAALSTARAEADGLFGGPWKTNLGHMFVNQEGPVASATFGDKGGHLTGRVWKLHFTGRFTQSRSSHYCKRAWNGSHYWGHFDLVLTKAAQEFRGMRAFCDQPLASGTLWTGRRDHESRF